MIISEPRETVEEIITGFKCDKCGKVVDREDDCFEHQEGLSIRMVGGYSAVYGDGSTLEFDLCQHCLWELVKDFARLNHGDTA